MYIRAKEKRNKNSNKIYYTHRLVESVRTEQGPRQKTILNLGTLDLEQKHWKPLADRIEELLIGQRRLTALDENIEALAQHFAKLLVQKKMAENNSQTASSQHGQIGLWTRGCKNKQAIAGFKTVIRKKICPLAGFLLQIAI